MYVFIGAEVKKIIYGTHCARNEKEKRPTAKWCVCFFFTFSKIFVAQTRAKVKKMNVKKYANKNLTFSYLI